jgi:soluble lytic murein transglycosylase-like protein
MELSMRFIVLALALVVVSEPALARKSSRAHLRTPSPIAADATPVLPQWQPGAPALQELGSTRSRRMRRVVTTRFDPTNGVRPAPLAAEPSSASYRSAEQGALAAMASRHAQMNGVPESLVHRVIMRESRYNPRAVSRGNYGLMQIRLGTARAMGYTGSAAGLLDPETNMTYAVRYLAGAYQAAGGNPGRAVAYYARGYHAQAKRRAVAPRAADAFGWAPAAVPIN